MHELTVEARPFPFRLPLHSTAVVIIDMQRDFVEPGGFGESLGNDVEPLQAVIAPVTRLLATARRTGLPIVHTREAHKPDLSDCPAAKRDRGAPRLRIGDRGPMGRILIEGEPGNDFVAELKPREDEHVISKPGKGAFYGTGLDAWLRQHGITHLLVAGVTTEVCVQTTLREANDRGYCCLLLEDCTGSYIPEFKRITVEMVVAQGGIVGWATPLDRLESAFEGVTDVG
ncbi:cysteine hydrolase family protein [Aquisalimonas asiatica]|uniref:Nicotinamidase-related amidase n=1 Tax=Aquisalimonas asiatica TaxID=406100 RepID=A0A1H8S3A1_9GAMM|nr:cysteine hydrolase [Aquisalimonas asiatica]SEO73459.1 Nicotinamidase-related amidase [Aquisalimonas asiatica]